MFFSALNALANNYVRVVVCLFVTRVDHPFSRSFMSRFEHCKSRVGVTYLKIDFNKTTDKIVIYAFFFFFLLLPHF